MAGGSGAGGAAASGTRAAGIRGAEGWVTRRGGAGSAGWPQFPQKRKEAGSFVPQRVQARAASAESGWPQPLQKVKEGSFSRPQRVQVGAGSMKGTLIACKRPGQTSPGAGEMGVPSRRFDPRRGGETPWHSRPDPTT